MSSPAGLEAQLGPSISISVGLILDCLKHLRTVIQNESLYLNSVKLKRESIRAACELFWCDEDIHSENKKESQRLKATMNLVDQVGKVVEKQQSVKSWVDVDKLLRTILPLKKNVLLDTASSSAWSLFFDPKILTLSLIEILIRLCESIRRLQIKLAIHGALLNVIHRSFIRPFNLLLWSYAKREVAN
ncbi:hypothetical protein HG535_0G04210 [Zygotorulaspora mrakii]|uniref:Uncharacterized protein n=1 Tax=Zygotorulaspora mrakii TaxID=42260 RepID=A0A7H9B730_ZYGMR|nr:uncharacterized protein HG535_0G04210 [Zygotorulaspora mrakii]QLG74538.1 hypothetical protein HG535_0G04210 [Zygotorulaspora mrakii]